MAESNPGPVSRYAMQQMWVPSEEFKQKRLRSVQYGGGGGMEGEKQGPSKRVDGSGTAQGMGRPGKEGGKDGPK